MTGRWRQALQVDGRGTMRNVALAGGARVVMLPISAASGLLATHLMVRQYGADGFGVYALVAFLPSLIPAADLGVNATIIDTVARREAIGRGAVRATLRRGLRRLMLSAAILMAGAALLGIYEAWPTLLGAHDRTHSINLAATLSVCVFALAVPAAIGLSALQGLQRTHTAVVIQGSVTALTLLLVWVGVATHAPLAIVAAAPSAASACAGVAACWLATPALRKELGRLSGGDRDIPRGLPLAGAFFVITLALPVTFQTDRIVLSHTRDLLSVAVYSAGSQLWAPCVGIVAAAGQSLWPAFTRQRASGRFDDSEFRRLVITFATVGGVFAGGLVLLGPPVSGLATSEHARAGYGLMAAFGLLLFAYAVQYPAGMFLMDPKGARFQAWCAVTMAALNVPLSVVLSRSMGPTGTVLASAVLCLSIMTLPAYLFRRSHPHGSTAPSSRGNLVSAGGPER